jgi:FdhE protein
MHAAWERRIRRSEELQRQWPFAREMLRFFRAVTSFQLDMYRRIEASKSLDAPKLDTAFLAAFFPPFLALVERHGPPDLSQLAQKFKDREEPDWERILRAYWNRNGSGGDQAVQFFPKAILQPYTMLRAVRWKAEVGAMGDTLDAASPPATCPFCGRAPVVSLLREHAENEAIGRALLCSLCATEWSFPRILCPSCKEGRPERLPRYTAPEIAWMRVEACETCHHYVKAVDLRKSPDSVPEVDEIGATPLDMVARDRGYTKLEVNIVGV